MNLFFVRKLLVMPDLIFDVFAYRGHILITYRESPVALLPLERISQHLLFVDSAGRCVFQIFHYFAQRMCLGCNEMRQ